jgi:hypothetical protein
MQKCIAGILADADADNMSKKEGNNKCDGTFFLLVIFAAIVAIVDICLNGLLE